MKIPFTKKQYEDLLRLVYLGNWIANATRDEPIKKYEELESYIFSFAKDFGMERWADYTSPDKTVFPTRWFEEESGVDELYEEYDKETFWDEAIEQFAERDFNQAHGEKEVSEMNEEEYSNKFYALRNRYVDEFKKHGIARLKIEEK